MHGEYNGEKRLTGKQMRSAFYSGAFTETRKEYK